MPSKKVTIYRKRSERYTAEQDAEATKKLGGFLGINGQPHVPLTLTEADELMPQILDMPVTDPTFRKEVREYFADISEEIPAEGKVLDIGYDEIERKVKDEEGKVKKVKTKEYKNIRDYLLYRLALNHPRTANDGEPNDGNDIMFYIVDPQRLRDEKNKETNLFMNAMELFLKKRKDFEAVKNIARIFLPEVNDPDQVESEDLITMMKGQIEADPQTFIDIANDKTLSTKAFLSKLISQQIVEKVGNAILFGEEKLGNSIEEAALYLEDKANSKTLLVLKQKSEAFAEL